MSTAFSPQTDGQTERLNRTIEEYIRSYIDVSNMKDWSKLLTPAEFAYNSMKHEATGMTPFEIDCGQQPNDPLFMFTNAAQQYTNNDRILNSLDDFINKMNLLWQTARNALLATQLLMKEEYDKHRTDEEFFVGDEAYLSTKRHMVYGSINYSSKATLNLNKFEPKYLGPFKIIGKPSKNAYRLQLPYSMKIHPVIHIRYLRRPKTTEKFLHRVVKKLPPETINNEEEYEVESILNKRYRKFGKGGRVEYLIHWKSYPSEEDTWEPISNLSNCRKLLKEFDSNFNVNDVVTMIEQFEVLNLHI